MSAHTPGPWRAWNPIGEEWAVTQSFSPPHVMPIRVADAIDNPADAHLVAAAPDLLAALYEALSELDRNPLDHDKCDQATIDARWRLEQRIEAAIAKAEGKP